MNADELIRRLQDVMRRCDPDQLQPGEQPCTDQEWDDVYKAAFDYLESCKS